MRKLLLLCLALFCINLWAQEVTSGSREIEFFAQGGHSVAGGRGDTTIFNAGARWGFGLFDLGRGSFQYELEAIPIYFVRQPIQNAYAISFTPFDVKYNFRRNAGRAIPFAELGGGVIIFNHAIPFGKNTVNLTTQLGLCDHVAFGQHGTHGEFALM